MSSNRFIPYIMVFHHLALGNSTFFSFNHKQCLDALPRFSFSFAPGSSHMLLFPSVSLCFSLFVSRSVAIALCPSHNFFLPSASCFSSGMSIKHYLQILTDFPLDSSPKHLGLSLLLCRKQNPTTCPFGTHAEREKKSFKFIFFVGICIYSPMFTDDKMSAENEQQNKCSDAWMRINNVIRRQISWQT